MADSLITALPAATSATGSQELPINDAGSDKKLTVDQISTYAKTGQPILLFVKSVSNLTAGAPADIATLTVPSGITRYRVTGATANQSYHFMITETQTGSPAAGTMAVFDQAGGAGNQMMATTAPNNGAGGGANWGTQVSTTIYTASTLFIRQMANSINSATISFYVFIEPLP